MAGAGTPGDQVEEVERAIPTEEGNPVSVEVEVSVRVEATPATLFRYFVDPERMCRWKGVEAELDPRPGGIYRVNVTGRDVALGEYVELVPDERVVFTWGWEGNDGVPPGSTTIEITLTPDGDATIVRLRHYDLPTDEAAASHTEGWKHYLERLAIAGAGDDAGHDPYTDTPD